MRGFVLHELLLFVSFCQDDNWKANNNKEDTGTSKVGKKNGRHGGGAFIPCTWKIECNEEYIGEVGRRLSLVVSEMGKEGADMVVEVR